MQKRKLDRLLRWIMLLWVVLTLAVLGVAMRGQRDTPSDSSRTLHSPWLARQIQGSLESKLA